jgi:hypothetical protein
LAGRTQTPDHCEPKRNCLEVQERAVSRRSFENKDLRKNEFEFPAVSYEISMKSGVDIFMFIGD